MMVKAFFGARKWRLWAYGGGLLILGSLCLQAYLALMFNFWQRDFFDMMQSMLEHGANYTRDDFFVGIMKFAWIVAAITAVGAATNFFKRMYILRWREAMTFYYLPLWQNVKKDVENANQRIQDDTREFAEIVTSLGVIIFEAAVSLIAFVPLLWVLNRKINIAWIKDTPGSLVWLVLAACIAGTVISRFVGNRLWRLEYNIQRAEANYRSELVLVEKVSKDKFRMDRFTRLFGTVRRCWDALYLQSGIFEIWNNAFTQCWVIFPFIIFSQNILAGIITWGTLQQIMNTVDQVRRRFSLGIDHWPMFMRLKSVRIRLSEFERSLEAYNLRPSGEGADK